MVEKIYPPSNTLCNEYWMDHSDRPQEPTSSSKVCMKKKMLKETAVYGEYVRWCERGDQTPLLDCLVNQKLSKEKAKCNNH